MKISRDKNIIIIEIEPSDGPPGTDQEKLADHMMAGMRLFLASPELQDRGAALLKTDSVIREELKAVASDQREKWEET
jgi:hypothetical protein